MKKNEKTPFNIVFTKMLKEYPVRGYFFIFSILFVGSFFGHFLLMPDDTDLHSFAVQVVMIPSAITLFRFLFSYMFENKEDEAGRNK